MVHKRYTERFRADKPGPSDTPLPPSAAVSTTQPESRFPWPNPGHEDHKELLRFIDGNFKVAFSVLEQIEKKVEKDINITINLDTGVLNEIRADVKSILEVVKKIDSGLSKAEEDKLAAQLHESRTGLQEAVEANQPPATSSSKKKKKSKSQ